MTKKLDDIQYIRDLDTHNILDCIGHFPEQIEEAVVIGRNFDISHIQVDDIKAIVFCGMGGSAIGGELIQYIAAHSAKIPIIINRNYNLPAFVDEHTLVICSSYSGNTEETLSALEDAGSRQAILLAITTNGNVEMQMQSRSVPYITIPNGYPPRHALAFTSIPLLVIFEKMGLIPDVIASIQETVHELNLLRNEIDVSIPQNNNFAKQLAENIHKRFPIIYAPETLFAPVASRWRGQLAENADMLASHHVLPEMNHNEIVAWQKKNKFVQDAIVIYLRDHGIGARLQKRMEITKAVLLRAGACVEEVWSRGVSVLSRVYSLVYIADYVSVYAAILNGVDPFSIDNINYLKEELSKS